MAGIGWVATLCALFALGEMRAPAALFHSTQRVSWNMVGAALAAAVPFSLLLSAFPDALARRLSVSPLYLARGIWGVMAFLSAGILMDRRVMPQGVVWHLCLLGAITAALPMLNEAWASKRSENDSAANFPPHALGLLVFAAGGMVSYQWLQGYGVGIWLLAVWLVVGYALSRLGEARRSAPIREVESGLLNLALFGAVLLLYRVVTSRFSEDIQPANLTDQYALFGLLVGAFTPALLSGYAERGANSLLRLLPAGLLTLAIPGVALLLYGAKCALALMIGAALSFASHPRAEKEASGDATSLTPNTQYLTPVFALALALTLSQWTGRALDYTLLAKAQKLHLLEAIGGATVLLILLTDYSGRFRTWREKSGKGVAQ